MRTLANSPAAADPVSAKIREIGDLIQKREPAEAERTALALLRAHPDRHDVHNILGVVYVQLKRRSKAVPHFEAAVKAQPQNPVYLNNLGRLYLDLDLIELALPPLTRALSINPRLGETLWAIGEYYRDLGKAEKGLPYLDKALKIEPDNVMVKSARGESLEALGRADEAKKVFDSLLKVPRLKPISLFRLSQIGKPKTDSPLFTEAQASLESPDYSDGERSRLHSALAHLHENSGDYARAFEQFERANLTQNLTFDIGNYRAWVDLLIQALTPAFFAKRRDVGHPSDLPVFVVGMPRSGTTLTEQIIASHPEAGGAGELGRLRRFAQRLDYQKNPPKFGETFDALGKKKILELADNFVDLLKFHAPGVRRVVDKMPHNFETLGFIALLFPNARVIHCRRNPADTCWSCYQNRLNSSHAYSKDLTTLGLYYREYMRLMEHWRKVLPIPIYESRYEELTSEPEASVRKLLDYVGLSWNPACLEFYKGGATVSTISRQQVRQPVYRSSVERWRRYEKQLAPLIEALGDCMEKSPA
jgi:tetratricopeptide (TPR) repeat protein